MEWDLTCLEHRPLKRYSKRQHSSGTQTERQRVGYLSCNPPYLRLGDGGVGDPDAPILGGVHRIVDANHGGRHRQRAVAAQDAVQQQHSEFEVGNTDDTDGHGKKSRGKGGGGGGRGWGGEMEERRRRRSGTRG